MWVPFPAVQFSSLLSVHHPPSPPPPIVQRRRAPSLFLFRLLVSIHILFFLYQKLRSHMDFARSAPDMTSEELNAFTRKRVCSNDCALTLQWKKTDLSHFHPFHSWRLSSFVEAIFRWWAQSHFHPLLQVAIGLLMHATTQILRWHFLFQPTL